MPVHASLFYMLYVYEQQGREGKVYVVYQHAIFSMVEKHVMGIMMRWSSVYALDHFLFVRFSRLAVCCKCVVECNSQQIEKT